MTDEPFSYRNRRFRFALLVTLHCELSSLQNKRLWK